MKILGYVALGLAAVNAVKKLGQKFSEMPSLYSRNDFGIESINWVRLIEYHRIKLEQNFIEFGNWFNEDGSHPFYLANPVIYVPDTNINPSDCGHTIPYSMYLTSVIGDEFFSHSQWGKMMGWQSGSYCRLTSITDIAAFTEGLFGSLRPEYDAREYYRKKMGKSRVEQMVSELRAYIYGRMVSDGKIPRDCLKR